MLTIGITGGIGCGKSSVTNVFSQLGIAVVDADSIAREIVAPGTQCLQQIVTHFGPQILNSNGNLKRRALRDIIFADSAAKQWLEALTHPEIRKKTHVALEQATGPYRIYSAPLLLESGQDSMVNRVLVVDVPESTQLERAAKRDSATKENIAAVMRTQWGREQRLAKADDIIDNSGDLTNTKAQIEALHQYYLTL